MRVALVGDVHTNLVAWRAVMRDMLQRDRCVSDIWALGDWLGYARVNPLSLWDCLRWQSHPAVSARLDSSRTWSVRGNHDIAVLDGLGHGQTILVIEGEARTAVDYQRRQVEKSADWGGPLGFAAWLRQLPLMLSPVEGVYLAHGAFLMDRPDAIPCYYTPRNLEHEGGRGSLRDWLRGDRKLPVQTALALEGWAEPVIMATGHSHLQAIWQRTGNEHYKDNWPEAVGSGISAQEIREACDSRQTLVHSIGRKTLVDQSGQCKLTPRPEDPAAARHDLGTLLYS